MTSSRTGTYSIETKHRLENRQRVLHIIEVRMVRILGKTTSSDLKMITDEPQSRRR
jgi:hypothetical protein